MTVTIRKVNDKITSEAELIERSPPCVIRATDVNDTREVKTYQRPSSLVHIVTGLPISAVFRRGC